MTAIRVSTRGKYGVKAMYELARAYGQGPTSVKAVAQEQELSEHYLEQLIAPLRKAGLVQSVRGAQGGYLLGRPPEAISVAEILAALEGPAEVGDCLSGPGLKIEGCATPERCVDHMVWVQLRDAIQSVLGDITLATLLQEAELSRRSDPMYFI